MNAHLLPCEDTKLTTVGTFSDAIITTGPIVLQKPTFAQVEHLANIVHAGLFSTAAEVTNIGEWYIANDKDGNAARLKAYHHAAWGTLVNPNENIIPCMPFVITINGEPVGVQGVSVGDDFCVTREFSTGSWLAPAARGYGLGTYARHAVLTFGFTVLLGEDAVSTANVHNTASNLVSAKCGYDTDGLKLTARYGEKVTLQRYRLTKRVWETKTKPPTDINLIP
jgi:RimJ/RimL family protein N-acetyltransferase